VRIGQGLTRPFYFYPLRLRRIAEPAVGVVKFVRNVRTTRQVNPACCTQPEALAEGWFCREWATNRVRNNQQISGMLIGMPEVFCGNQPSTKVL
jgi:hypothetical protein